MKYEAIKDTKDEEFRRLTGVKKFTFNKMVEILAAEEKIQKARGGRKNRLSLQDRLLMTLEYLREYRTYFHISKSYGVCESTAYETIKWVENTLIKHKDFALPGRKALKNSDEKYEVILVDATESPIERPKKNKNTIIQGKRNDIP